MVESVALGFCGHLLALSVRRTHTFSHTICLLPHTSHTFCLTLPQQSQSASLGVVAGICQVLLALWKVLGACSVLQVEAVLQNVLLRLADGE